MAPSFPFPCAVGPCRSCRAPSPSLQRCTASASLCPPHTTPSPCTLRHARIPQELQSAIAFVAEVHGQRYTPELLAVLEHLVDGAGGSTAATAATAPTAPAAGGKASANTPRGLAAVIVAQGLLPGLATAAASEAAEAAVAAGAAAGAKRRSSGGSLSPRPAPAFVAAAAAVAASASHPELTVAADGPGVGAGAGGAAAADSVALVKRRVMPLLMVLLSR